MQPRQHKAKIPHEISLLLTCPPLPDVCSIDEGGNMSNCYAKLQHRKEAFVYSKHTSAQLGDSQFG